MILYFLNFINYFINSICGKNLIRFLFKFRNCKFSCVIYCCRDEEIKFFRFYDEKFLTLFHSCCRANSLFTKNEFFIHKEIFLLSVESSVWFIDPTSNLY